MAHDLTRVEWKLVSGTTPATPITRTPSRVPLHHAPTFKNAEGKEISETMMARLVEGGILMPLPDDVRAALLAGGKGVIHYVLTNTGAATVERLAADYDPNRRRKKGKARRHDGAR